MPDTDCAGSVDLHTVEKKYQLPFFSIIWILKFFPIKAECFPLFSSLSCYWSAHVWFSTLQRLTFHPYAVAVTRALVLFPFLWMFLPCITIEIQSFFLKGGAGLCYHLCFIFLACGWYWCFKTGMHVAPYMQLGLSREKEDIIPGPRSLQFLWNL